MMHSSRLLRLAGLAAGVAVASAVLVACGKKHESASQSVARVDGAEITVHDVNYRLVRLRGIRPEQKEAAERKILNDLISEQLFVARVEKEKLDKTNDAQQATDAARRAVLEGAFLDQVAMGVKPPTDDAMRKFYADNDLIFAHRRVYALHQYLAVVPVERQPELRAMIDAGKPQDQIVAWVKGVSPQMRDQLETSAPERLPAPLRKELANVPDGRGMLAAAGNQVRLTFIESSTSQSVDFDHAKPAISNMMLLDARNQAKLAARDALRTAAKIEYASPYQSLAASGPAPQTTRDLAVGASIGPASDARVSLPGTGAASGVQVTLPTTGVASSGVQVSLPTTSTPGVRVSLPTTPASSVEVRLPPQSGGGDAGKK